MDGVDAMGCWACGEAALGGVLDTRTIEHQELEETISLTARLNIKYRNILSYLWARIAKANTDWEKIKRK